MRFFFISFLWAISVGMYICVGMLRVVLWCPIMCASFKGVLLYVGVVLYECGGVSFNIIVCLCVGVSFKIVLCG